MAKDKLEEGTAEIVISQPCQVPGEKPNTVRPATVGETIVADTDTCLDIVGAKRGVFVRGGPQNDPDEAERIQEAAAEEAAAAKSKKTRDPGI